MSDEYIPDHVSQYVPDRGPIDEPGEPEAAPILSSPKIGPRVESTAPMFIVDEIGHRSTAEELKREMKLSGSPLSLLLGLPYA